MKEICTTWEEAKTQISTLSEKCPLQGVCTEGCLMVVTPIERNRRLEKVHERVRHYSDVPDHLARSKANHK